MNIHSTCLRECTELSSQSKDTKPLKCRTASSVSHQESKCMDRFSKIFGLRWELVSSPHMFHKGHVSAHHSSIWICFPPDSIWSVGLWISMESLRLITHLLELSVLSAPYIKSELYAVAVSSCSHQPILQHCMLFGTHFTRIFQSPAHLFFSYWMILYKNQENLYWGDFTSQPPSAPNKHLV